MITLLFSESADGSIEDRLMYATNSLSINFTPSSDPASCISDDGMPMHQAIGAKIHPAILSRVIDSPAT